MWHVYYKWLVLAGLISLVAYGVFTHQSFVPNIVVDSVSSLVHTTQRIIAPCSHPTTYSIGSIDSRFGIATSTLVADLMDAEQIWEKPSGKNLFMYEPSGGEVTINLTYDTRQAATDKLIAMGLDIKTDTSTYTTLKAKYDTLDAQVATEKSSYDVAVATYKTNEAAYNTEVEQWNARGGAPASVYKQLQQQKTVLDTDYASIKSIESTLNTNISTLSALATVLNQLIVQLNLKVGQYNQTGAQAGQFEEGVYQVTNGVRTIDVYEYSNHIQLVRVLAHEMGHALGLDHVSDPQAIMYKINSGTSLLATTADLTELDQVCKLKSDR